MYSRLCNFNHYLQTNNRKRYKVARFTEISVTHESVFCWLWISRYLPRWGRVLLSWVCSQRRSSKSWHRGQDVWSICWSPHRGWYPVQLWFRYVTLSYMQAYINRMVMRDIVLRLSLRLGSSLVPLPPPPQGGLHMIYINITKPIAQFSFSVFHFINKTVKISDLIWIN